MPNPHPHQTPARPTPSQHRLLRQLAERTGTSFTPPSTKAQAHREIARLLSQNRDSRADQVRDRRRVQADLQTGTGDAVRHHETDTTGHGSSAQWTHTSRGEGR